MCLWSRVVGISKFPPIIPEHCCVFSNKKYFEVQNTMWTTQTAASCSVTFPQCRFQSFLWQHTCAKVSEPGNSDSADGKCSLYV